MITTTLSQPESQLGAEFMELLAAEFPYTRIIFVSAFTALKTILRLRERMLSAAEAGTLIRLIVGIDLGGTSKEVLEELSLWNCEAYIYHNPIPRATFHPKIYLFERESGSTLFLGSNNLTDGGFYTNYEACTCHTFEFPADTDEYERLLQPIKSFLNPAGPTVRRVDASLIRIMSDRGVLATELDARRSRRERYVHPPSHSENLPANPFSPVSVPLPPLLPMDIRQASLRRATIEVQEEEVVVVSLIRQSFDGDGISTT